MWPRENGTLCPFGASYPSFIVIFHLIWPIQLGIRQKGRVQEGLDETWHRTSLISFQLNSNYIPETWNNHDCHWQQCIFSRLLKNKNARPKCASRMNHTWAITLFGQARFTPARFAEYQTTTGNIGQMCVQNAINQHERRQTWDCWGSLFGTLFAICTFWAKVQRTKKHVFKRALSIFSGNAWPQGYFYF